jgi:antitoxin component YwqK of YwqJK toxin-antitoxin module
MIKNRYYILLLCLMAQLLYAQDDKKSNKEKYDATAQKMKDKKAKFDTLTKGLPLGITGGSLGSGPSANVGGKNINAAEFLTETLPDLGLKLKEARKREKKRRDDKKTYHTEYAGLGIAPKVIATGNDRREEFHVLKEYKDGSPYSPTITWFDSRANRLSSAAVNNNEDAMMLHGPYKRYQGDKLIEEGFYHIGAKDGRWEVYDANYMLLDKSNWSKGFPTESIITYYDSAHTKVCEVIPIQFGKRKGDYLKYYEGGQLMAKGRYDNDMPINTWTEYYQLRRQRKKETRYPRFWYEDSEPVVLNEWDDKGKLIYQAPKSQTTEEVEN